MKFTLEIETGNDAFYPDASIELARLLHKVADRIVTYNDFSGGRILDINGSKVGSFKATEGES